MRILVVAEQYPWPAVDGYRRRLDHIVRGLARAGDVEVLALHRAGTAAPTAPSIPGVIAHAIEVGPDAGLRGWIGRWVRGGLPRRVLGPDWLPLRERLTAMAASGTGGYDLVWFSHVDSWVGVADLTAGIPTVVDFDNLEDLALSLRRRVPPRFPPDSGVPTRFKVIVRWVVSRLFDLIDQRRWTRLQQRCAANVANVVVCSALDVTRSGCDNAVVIGNGADRPESVSVDRTELRSENPTMLFVGALDYEPNTEAVEWFAREVMPRVRESVPDARARIVGRGHELLVWVRGVEGIDLIGSVPSVEPELARADVSIVPINVGAGTRLKVVEALANRIPMVTTTVGCEGIDLVDGMHALIADDPTKFAQACAKLLSDPQLRQQLADHGAELFELAYDWEIIEQRISELASGLVGRT